jgi:hypothetical protein
MVGVSDACSEPKEDQVSDAGESQQFSRGMCHETLRTDVDRVILCELEAGHTGPHHNLAEGVRSVIPEVTYVSTPNGPAINPDELAEWLSSGTKSSPDEEGGTATPDRH